MHQIQRMLPRHFKMLDMCVAGHNNRAIAAALEIGESAVSLITRSPFFQAELSRRRKETSSDLMEEDRKAFQGKTRSVMKQAQGILEDASPDAARVLTGLMSNSKSDGIKLQTATKILDRVFGPGEKKQEASVSISITSENAQLIMVALKESNNARRQEYGNTADSTSPFHPQGEQGDVREEGPEASSVSGSREALPQDRRSEENLDAGQSCRQENRREVIWSNGREIVVGQEGENIGQDQEHGTRCEETREEIEEDSREV